MGDFIFLSRAGSTDKIRLKPLNKNKRHLKINK